VELLENVFEKLPAQVLLLKATSARPVASLVPPKLLADWLVEVHWMLGVAWKQMVRSLEKQVPLVSLRDETRMCPLMVGMVAALMPQKIGQPLERLMALVLFLEELLTSCRPPLVALAARWNHRILRVRLHHFQLVALVEAWVLQARLPDFQMAVLVVLAEAWIMQKACPRR